MILVGFAIVRKHNPSPVTVLIAPMNPAAILPITAAAPSVDKVMLKQAVHVRILNAF